MTRLLRASVIVTLFLAWAEAASAECAWDARASGVDRPVRESIGRVHVP